MGGEGHGPRQLSATEVAALTGGRLLGPDGARITAIAPLERARPDELSFVATAKYKDALAQSRAGVVLCTAEFADAPGPRTRIVVAQPHEALLALLPVLYPEAAWMPGIHPTAVIGRGATWSDPVAIGPHVVLGQDVRLGKNVRIGAGCVLGDGVVVGDDVQLFPQVTCYSGTVLGDRVIAHAGARLGSDGFGYVPGGHGRAHRKIPAPRSTTWSRSPITCTSASAASSRRWRGSPAARTWATRCSWAARSASRITSPSAAA